MRFTTITTAGDFDEWRKAVRDDQARQVLSSGMEELERRTLEFGTRWIEHRPSGRFYRHWGGDPGFAPDGAVYYVTESGQPVVMEPAVPASRAELEQRRAARDARRAARKAEIKERRDRDRAGR